MSFAEKRLSVLDPIRIGERFVKRYHVTPFPGPIEAEIEEAAQAFLPGLLPQADGTPPASFAVLHRGGDGAAYLNVYSWYWDNALYYGCAAAAQPALGCPDDDPTHFVKLEAPLVGCVWELPPILHERDAWVRHMLVPERPDLDAYLADSLPEGTTGDRPQTITAG
ncbi:hypothetical protein [Streptacidiphilus sp. EB129]|jgi:hypothetical protein|uniref:hypothetical protein n=1 Tax=Streptacidiphilus sp. EB129 TaxID=3156262 RepID=UPI00351720DF